MRRSVASCPPIQPLYAIPPLPTVLQCRTIHLCARTTIICLPSALSSNAVSLPLTTYSHATASHVISPPRPSSADLPSSSPSRIQVHLRPCLLSASAAQISHASARFAAATSGNPPSQLQPIHGCRSHQDKGTIWECMGFVLHLILISIYTLLLIFLLNVLLIFKSRVEKEKRKQNGGEKTVKVLFSQVVVFGYKFRNALGQVFANLGLDL